MRPKTTALSVGRKLHERRGVSGVMQFRLGSILLLSALAIACGDRRGTVFPADAGNGMDSGIRDGETLDTLDAREGNDGVETDTVDSGAGDSGSDGGAADTSVRDSGPGDAGPGDASSVDSRPMDSGPSTDSGAMDGGTDTGSMDVPMDTGPPGGCISGATGTHALRFRWEGSGSTAYVRYETNTLPDTSRWRVSANSRSIGYRPVFSDPFLGEGGLELSGTVFIDVELSTEGLGRVDQATLSIYGRSYNTTSSGSFSWRTFSGTGASPRGGVANSAPYEWYSANATASLPGGDDSILLRIEAGPPSNALIINRVEVCFTAR